MNVGDTVKTYNTEFYPNSVVTSIDSILIGLQYRKRWNVYMQGGCSGNWNAQIIEGIGSTYGLLDQRTPYGFCMTYGKLYCFSQNNQTLYPHYSATAGCSQVTGIEKYSTNNNISIYPNPATNSLQVSLSGNSTIKEIALYDVLGNEVPIPNPFQRKGNSTSIDVSALANGVYFINLKTSEGVLSKKLVVNK